jgi:hypothetical protein
MLRHLIKNFDLSLASLTDGPPLKTTILLAYTMDPMIKDNVI